MSKRRVIVCAACKLSDGTLVCGPRHWDMTMHGQMRKMYRHVPTRHVVISNAIEGFVDQFGVFHSRKEALAIVRENGQPFDAERNKSDTELFSEGLY